MAKLKLDNLNKVYPSGVQAVYDFSIDIDDGEFIVFVGPSGCGKTTTLRMIAGLESITSGTLTIEDKVVNNLSPRERDIAMAFQNYALYDQMTVYHNMAFSLTLLRKPAEEIHNKVMKAAKMLELESVLNRKPKQLSGGQKQRVALGRAIVRNPKVFLLDEPLSNLDVKLRDSARKELADLHRQLNATFVYVTHDQIEAMTLASRIVILDKGRIQQIGTPSEVYNNPQNIFVATFIGSPAMNVFNATFQNSDITVDAIKIPISNSLQKVLKEKYTNKSFKLGVRPEDMIVSKDVISNGFEQEIDFVEFLGENTLLHFTFGGEKMVSKVMSKLAITAGETIHILFDVDKIKLFDSETGVRIN